MRRDSRCRPDLETPIGEGDLLATQRAQETGFAYSIRVVSFRSYGGQQSWNVVKPVWPLITSRWVDLAWSGLLMNEDDGTKENGTRCRGSGRPATRRRR